MNIKISCYITICLLGITSLSAQNIENIDGEKYLKDTRHITGDRTESAIKGDITDDRIGGKFDNYMDTVIWNDTKKRKTDKVSQTQLIQSGQGTIPLDSPIDRLNAEWEKEEQRLAQLKLADTNKTIPSVFTGGYCTLHDTLSISKSNVYGKLDCLLDFGKGQYKKVEVFTSFYPDYKREMVIAIPSYVAFENQNRATFSGIVLKSDKTSVNVAGWVDNKRLQKLLGEGLLATNDTIYRYATGYMRALAESKRNDTVDYVTTTGPNGFQTLVPIRRTNIEPPEVKDYLITGGIELLSNIFSIKGKDYLYSQKPLFAVYPQKLYIEGVISYDNEGLARRFGQISQSEAKKADTNSKEWTRDRNEIIQKYDRTYKSAVPVSANR